MPDHWKSPALLKLVRGLALGFAKERLVLVGLLVADPDMEAISFTGPLSREFQQRVVDLWNELGLENVIDTSADWVN